jgi:hypothetical protein
MNGTLQKLFSVVLQEFSCRTCCHQILSGLMHEVLHGLLLLTDTSGDGPISGTGGFEGMFQIFAGVYFSVEQYYTHWCQVVSEGTSKSSKVERRSNVRKLNFCARQTKSISS